MLTYNFRFWNFLIIHENSANNKTYIDEDWYSVIVNWLRHVNKTVYGIRRTLHWINGIHQIFSTAFKNVKKGTTTTTNKRLNNSYTDTHIQCAGLLSMIAWYSFHSFAGLIVIWSVSVFVSVFMVSAHLKFGVYINTCLI